MTGYVNNFLHTTTQLQLFVAVLEQITVRFCIKRNTKQVSTEYVKWHVICKMTIITPEKNKK